MSLTQAQINALFDSIPSEQSLIFKNDDCIRVHYYEGVSVIMTEAEFDNYDQAISHFQNMTLHCDQPYDED